MLRQLALMVAGFVLLSATAGLAAPRAAEGGDTATTTLNLSVPPLYLPVDVQLTTFVSQDPKDGVTNR